MKNFILSIASATLLLSSVSAFADADYYAKNDPKYYGSHLCAYQQFKCVQVEKGATWARMFPDKRQREMVKRLNRTNIALRYRSWIVVPNNLESTNYLDLSPFPRQINPEGRKMLVVKLKQQAFAAYDPNGKLVHWGPVSSGKNWCSDIGRPCKTAAGSHIIFNKKGAQCESNTFPVDTAGGAVMPYCMFYFRGFAMHGADLPGYNASHGCIRMFTEDAKWLNHHFASIGTRVVVLNQ